MDIEITENKSSADPRLKKYSVAGYGFLTLNILYIVLAWVFLPPFNLGLSAILSVFMVLALVVLCTLFIIRGNKRLTQALAILYGGRSLFSIYTLVAGDTFAGVPYFIPCLILTCYLLGRAGWNWP